MTMALLRSLTLAGQPGHVPSVQHMFYTFMLLPRRSFSSTSPQLLRKTRTTNKKIQARRSTTKKTIKKSIYDSEKMTLKDAINILRAVEVSKPHSTIELVVKTAMGRGAAIPKGRIQFPRQPKEKKKDRILVFAEGRQAEEARRAGAEFVGGTELIDGVANGKYPATTYLCTPALLRAIAPKLGRILGPRGLMPSERRGTVTDDIAGYLRRIQGTSEWKGDKAGTIRTAIAKIDFPLDDILQNARHFLSVVKKATGNSSEKDTSAKKTRSVVPVNAITRVILSSTQGPGIPISDA